MKIPGSLRRLWARADRVAGDFRAASTCPTTPGCSACCRQDVMAWPIEAKAIWRMLSADQRRAVMDSDAERLGNRCPLLTPDGACGIYAFRPVICRTYLVDSDPKHCSDASSMVPTFLRVLHQISGIDGSQAEGTLIAALQRHGGKR